MRDRMEMWRVKFRVNRILRIALIILFTALFAISAFYLVRSLTRTGTVEQKAQEYSYSQKAGVNYRVYVKPNSLYAEKSLDPGKVYVTNFVDKVNTFFTYSFSGERPAGVKGRYDVVAVLEASLARENKKVKVWQREFLLQPKTEFAGRDKVVSVQREIPLMVQDYLEFTRKVIKESELTPEEVNLTVRWNIEVEAETDKGTVKDQITPAMVIPLSQKAFEVGGELVKEKADAISTVKQVPAVVDRKAVTAGATAAALCAVILAVLLLLTSGAAGEADPLQRAVNQIFKKHGDRMAVIDGDLPGAFENLIQVKAIDDLVRIADEISRPIMYKPLSGQGEIPSFYVFDERKTFVFKMN